MSTCISGLRRGPHCCGQTQPWRSRRRSNSLRPLWVKAIIEISVRNSIFDAAMADIATGGNEDFHLSFESARQLFAEITPARLDLWDTLRKNGPCSIYALAKAAARNYSSPHRRRPAH